jgi:zinc transporter ZupT
MFELALLLSIAGLLIGPALLSWVRGYASALATFDAAMLGVVLPLLILRLIPHLVDEIGPVAVAAVVSGYAAFTAIGSRRHARAPRLGVAILLPMLAIHSFVDGAALAVAFQREVAATMGWALGAAIVLHRVPEGIVVASVLIPIHGLRATMLRMSVLAVFTVIGGVVGRELISRTTDRALHLVVSVGIGVMLGMILHRHRDPGAGHRNWREVVAFLVAAATSITVAVCSAG